MNERDGESRSEDHLSSRNAESKSLQEEQQPDAWQHATDRKSGERGVEDSKKDEKASEKAAKKSPLKKPWVRLGIIVAAVVLVISGAAYGIYYYTNGRYFQSTNDAYLKADQVNIASQASGYIVQLDVAANQKVDARERLVKIDDAGYRAKVDQARAQLEQSIANEDEARAELEKQPAQIGQARAQLDQSQASLRYAESEVTRYQPLAASGAETKEKLAQLISNRDQGIAQVALNQAQLETQKLTIPSLVAKLAQAAATTRQSDAQLKQAQIDLNNTVIVSSIQGRIGDLTARLGQYVQSGVQLMTVVPIDFFYLEANFKETQIGLMRVGQPATVKVDALPDLKLRGEVVSFSPGTGSQFSLIPPQNATGNFTKVVQRIPVRIRVDAGPEARKVLVPGLSVTAEIDTRNAKDYPGQAKEDERRLKGPGAKP